MKNVSIKNIQKKFFTVRRGTVEALKGLILKLKQESFLCFLVPADVVNQLC